MTTAQLLVVGGAFCNLGFCQTLATPLLWQSTLKLSAPLILAAVGGTISERSGVVNIAMEGMMLMSAFFSAYIADKSASIAGLSPTAAVAVGVFGGVVVGCLIAWLHAWASIRFFANQIVSGMAINLLALGLTSYLYYTLYGSQGTPPNLAGMGNTNIPVLGGIHFASLGFILFQQNIVIYLAFASVAIAHIFLFRTKLGLRIRSVGEHPRAADTAGIKVQRLRYIAVITSGGLSGLAGAWFSLSGPSGLFTDNMTGGKGFIALAAMILGKWTPIGAMGACLLFGFGEALAVTLGSQLSIAGYQVSVYEVNMLPYVITIVAVAGLIGRSTPPAADGLPYDPAEGGA
jgi:general nucleoside transport system permease protein